jgi:uncharacterized protein YjbI with pentapeptide repeats
MPDLAMPDLAGADLSSVDQATADLASVDTATPADLSSQDLAGADFANDDLTVPPDLFDHCKDGKRDVDESDTDCGGSCAGCGLGKNCFSGTDCASGVCVPITNICG